MKGNEMIKIIQEHNLQDFELEFVISDVNEFGISVKTYAIEELCDIGYSENCVSFEGELK